MKQLMPLWVRKLNRILSFFLITALLSASLCACSFMERHEQKTAATRVSFSWWGNDERHEYTMDGVDLFMERNPDIDVNYRYSVWQGYEKRNRVAMMSGTESDVMQINYAWLEEFSPDGKGYYDLNELSDYIDLSNYSKEYLQYGSRNGKLNALPIAVNSLIFLYNKDIWDSYGLPLPTTWDDLFQAAKVMSPDGVYPLGMVKKMAFLMCVANFEQTHSKTVLDKDGHLNISDEEIGDILDFYVRLIDEKVLLPVDDFDKNQFNGNLMGGNLCWISDTGNIANIMESGGHTPAIGEYIMQPGAEVTGWYLKPSTLYAISKHTSHPQEAAELLNYLVNDPDMAILQKCEKGVPVSVTAKSTLKLNNMLEGFEYESNEYMQKNQKRLGLLPTLLESDELIGAFKSAGDDYIYEKADRTACVASIRKECERR